MTRAVVVIPARYKSSRFPGKPLVELLGRPMIVRVAEICAKAVGQDNVYVATEDSRIQNCVEQHGFQSVMTSDDPLTGTDRIAEAARQIDATWFVNVQGDEPMLDPNDIRKVIETRRTHPEDIVNAYSWLNTGEDPHNVNLPKVLVNESEMLVYMSRVALPGSKHAETAPKYHRKQVCIYAFSRQDLDDFYGYGRKSELEAYEDIEILRFLELNRCIRMVQASASSLAVDTPEDVPRVEAALSAKR